MKKLIELKNLPQMIIVRQLILIKVNPTQLIVNHPLNTINTKIHSIQLKIKVILKNMILNKIHKIKI